MLWTIDCEGNKIINLLIKNLTFSLECFLEDYKDRNKKFNEWTKVAKTLQSQIAQVFFFLFVIFILHSRGSDVSLCYGR